MQVVSKRSKVIKSFVKDHIAFRNEAAMTKLISIIIPIYNVAPYLGECLASLLDQTYQDWEAVCVDDGSVDGSGRILDEFAMRDKRFKVIHQENVGVSEARNVGIRMAKGEWIGFIDPDDVVAPQWLKIANEEMGAGVDAVRLDATIWRDGTPRPIVSGPSSTMVIRGRDAVLAWGWRIMTKSGWSWATFVRKSILLGLSPNFFPRGVRYSEDSIFGLSYIYKVSSVARIDFKGYFYRMRPASACGARRSVPERIAFYDAYQELLQQNSLCGISQNVFRELDKLALSFAWANLVIWAIRPEDIERVSQLRHRFRNLLRHQKWRLIDLPLHWRGAAWLFLNLGLVYPINISMCVIRTLTYMNNCQVSRLIRKCIARLFALGRE